MKAIRIIIAVASSEEERCISKPSNYMHGTKGKKHRGQARETEQKWSPRIEPGVKFENHLVAQLQKTQIFNNTG